jgi:hypothetical protein
MSRMVRGSSRPTRPQSQGHRRAVGCPARPTISARHTRLRPDQRFHTLWTRDATGSPSVVRCVAVRSPASDRCADRARSPMPASFHPRRPTCDVQTRHETARCWVISRNHAPSVQPWQSHAPGSPVQISGTRPQSSQHLSVSGGVREHRHDGGAAPCRRPALAGFAPTAPQ